MTQWSYPLLRAEEDDADSNSCPIYGMLMNVMDTGRIKIIRVFLISWSTCATNLPPINHPPIDHPPINQHVICHPCRVHPLHLDGTSFAWLCSRKIRGNHLDQSPGVIKANVTDLLPPGSYKSRRPHSSHTWRMARLMEMPSSSKLNGEEIHSCYGWLCWVIRNDQQMHLILLRVTVDPLNCARKLGDAHPSVPGNSEKPLETHNLV